MSRIVFVHGIGQGKLTREELLRASEADLVAHGLAEVGSVGAPYYADCHRDSESMAAGEDPFGADSLDGIDEDDPLQAELLRLFTDDVETEDAMGVSREFLDGYTRSSLSYPLQHAVVAVIRSVGRHLSRRAIRECAIRRVAAAITDDTRVVVAHSLGSVVAYESLFRRPLERPPVLLTLGSPLGLAPVRASLRDRFVVSDGKLPEPPVESWVNVSVADDWVPAVPVLGDYFHGAQDLPLPGSGIFGPPFPAVHGRSSYLALDEVADVMRAAVAR